MIHNSSHVSPSAKSQYVGRETAESHNTAYQLSQQKAAVGDKFITRFPPEPNGYLHIGHAKAMHVNFSFAQQNNGDCILRFDDTNPETEKVEYIEHILENVRWLGYEPTKITRSSDYFEQLYWFAVFLIEKGKAYVDHLTAEEIKHSRKYKQVSPYRDRSVAKNLRLFADMRNGKFDEGSATLRMKGDMNHSNPQMWDLVAYRIKYTPHPHAHDKWCIYPSYDFAHCIIDSLEHVTHSFCTLEFESRRESYFWLLNELDLYKPNVWEYSRLNVEYNVLSKRKLLKLIAEKHVNGWDDPRLLTLDGLRRRGYTSQTINEFCKLVGVSRNDNMIPVNLLEHCARQNLEDVAIRAMCILYPIKVILTNFPKDVSRGTHVVPFSRILYIDQADVRLEDSKNFFGLAPNKELHLKYAYNITANKINIDDNNKITSIEATVDLSNTRKPKGKITWVARPGNGIEPLNVQVRLYENLFKSKDPCSTKDWIHDLNPNSVTILHSAYVDPSVSNCKPYDKYQFERVGFFSVDTDTDATNGVYVFNRTTTLYQTKDKAKDTKNNVI